MKEAHVGTSYIEWKAGPCMDRIQFADDGSFIERLLARSDQFEAVGAHRQASELRRELVIELLDQLNTRDEAELGLMAEKKMPEIREQLDIGQTE